MVAPRAASALPPPRGGRSTPRVAGPPSPMLRHAYDPSALSADEHNGDRARGTRGSAARLSGILSRAASTRSRCPDGPPVCRRCRRAPRSKSISTTAAYSPRRPVHDLVDLPRHDGARADPRDQRDAARAEPREDRHDGARANPRAGAARVSRREPTPPLALHARCCRLLRRAGLLRRVAGAFQRVLA